MTGDPKKKRFEAYAGMRESGDIKFSDQEMETYMADAANRESFHGFLTGKYEDVRQYSEWEADWFPEYSKKKGSGDGSAESLGSSSETEPTIPEGEVAVATYDTFSDEGILPPTADGLPKEADEVNYLEGMDATTMPESTAMPTIKTEAQFNDAILTQQQSYIDLMKSVPMETLSDPVQAFDILATDDTARALHNDPNSSDWTRGHIKANTIGEAIRLTKDRVSLIEGAIDEQTLDRYSDAKAAIIDIYNSGDEATTIQGRGMQQWIDDYDMLLASEPSLAEYDALNQNLYSLGTAYEGIKNVNPTYFADQEKRKNRQIMADVLFSTTTLPGQELPRIVGLAAAQEGQALVKGMVGFVGAVGNSFGNSAERYDWADKWAETAARKLDYGYMLTMPSFAVRDVFTSTAKIGNYQIDVDSKGVPIAVRDQAGYLIYDEDTRKQIIDQYESAPDKYDIKYRPHLAPSISIATQGALQVLVTSKFAGLGRTASAAKGLTAGMLTARFAGQNYIQALEEWGPEHATTAARFSIATAAMQAGVSIYVNPLEIKLNPKFAVSSKTLKSISKDLAGGRHADVALRNGWRSYSQDMMRGIASYGSEVGKEGIEGLMETAIDIEGRKIVRSSTDIKLEYDGSAYAYIDGLTSEMIGASIAAGAMISNTNQWQQESLLVAFENKDRILPMIAKMHGPEAEATLKLAFDAASKKIVGSTHTREQKNKIVLDEYNKIVEAQEAEPTEAKPTETKPAEVKTKPAEAKPVEKTTEAKPVATIYDIVRQEAKELLLNPGDTFTAEGGTQFAVISEGVNDGDVLVRNEDNGQESNKTKQEIRTTIRAKYDGIVATQFPGTQVARFNSLRQGAMELASQGALSAPKVAATTNPVTNTIKQQGKNIGIKEEALTRATNVAIKQNATSAVLNQGEGDANFSISVEYDDGSTEEFNFASNGTYLGAQAATAAPPLITEPTAQAGITPKAETPAAAVPQVNTALEMAAQQGIEFNSPREALTFVSENSNDPLELARSYVESRAMDDTRAGLSNVDSIIEENELFVMTKADFSEVYDANVLKGDNKMQKRYVNDKNPAYRNLDDRLASASERAGVEITANDVVSYIERYERGDIESRKAGTVSETSRAIANRFKTVAGKTLSMANAEKVIDAELAKIDENYENYLNQEAETYAELEEKYYEAIQRGEIPAPESDAQAGSTERLSPRTYTRETIHQAEGIDVASIAPLLNVVSEISPNMSVEVYETQADMEVAVGKKGNAFVSDDGSRIVMSKESSISDMIHEVIHPIVVAAEMSQAGTIDSFYQEVLSAMPESVRNDMEAFMVSYKDVAPDVRREEVVVEFLTRVSNGTYGMDVFKEEGVLDKALNWFQNLFAKMGLVNAPSDLNSLKAFTKKVVAAIKEGRPIGFSNPPTDEAGIPYTAHGRKVYYEGKEYYAHDTNLSDYESGVYTEKTYDLVPVDGYEENGLIKDGVETVAGVSGMDLYPIWPKRTLNELNKARRGHLKLIFEGEEVFIPHNELPQMHGLPITSDPRPWIEQNRPDLLEQYDAGMVKKKEWSDSFDKAVVKDDLRASLGQATLDPAYLRAKKWMKSQMGRPRADVIADVVGLFGVDVAQAEIMHDVLWNSPDSRRYSPMAGFKTDRKGLGGALDSAMQLRNEWLLKSKGMPKDVMQSMEYAMGESERLTRQVSDAWIRVNKMIDKLPKAEAQRVLNLANAFVEGSIVATDVATIPQNIWAELTFIRSQIDSISVEILNDNDFTGLRTEIIASNFGEYLSRVFRVHLESKYTPEKASIEKYVQEYRRRFYTELAAEHTLKYPNASQAQLDKFIRDRAKNSYGEILDEYSDQLGGQGKSKSSKPTGIMKERKEFPKRAGDLWEMIDQNKFGPMALPSGNYPLTNTGNPEFEAAFNAAWNDMRQDRLREAYYVHPELKSEYTKLERVGARLATLMNNMGLVAPGTNPFNKEEIRKAVEERSPFNVPILPPAVNQAQAQAFYDTLNDLNDRLVRISNRVYERVNADLDAILMGKDLIEPGDGFRSMRHLTPGVRAILGEVSPLDATVFTMAKLGNYYTLNKYYQSLRAIGEGQFIFRADDNFRPVWATHKIAGKDTEVVGGRPDAASERLAPLSGMYTSREIGEMITNVEKYADMSFGLGVKTWMKGNAVVQYSKTILSPETQAKNVLSNLWIVARNVWVDPVRMALGFAYVPADFMLRHLTNGKRLSTADTGPLAPLKQMADALEFAIRENFYHGYDRIDKGDPKRLKFDTSDPAQMAAYKAAKRDMVAAMKKRETKSAMVNDAIVKYGITEDQAIGIHAEANQKSYKENMAEVINKLGSAGVLGTNVSLKVIYSNLGLIDSREKATRYVTNSILFDDASNLKWVARKAVQPLKWVASTAEKTYSFGDDMFKIFGYLRERATYSKILFNKEYWQLNDQQTAEVDAKSIEIVKNIIPNYDRIGKLGIFISKSPFVGQFIGFKIEALRCWSNQITLSLKEMNDGRKSNNPRMALHGAARLSGNLVMTGMAKSLEVSIAMWASKTVPAAWSSIGGYLSGLLGMDDEGDDDLRKLLRDVQAPYAKNDWFAITEVGDGDGVIETVSISANHPFGDFQRALIAGQMSLDATEGEGFIDSAVHTGILMATELFGSFADGKIIAKTVKELTSNKDSYGNNIYNESTADYQGDVKGVIAMKSFSYILKRTGPGFIGQLSKLGALDKLPENEWFGSFRKPAHAGSFGREILGMGTGFKPIRRNIYDDFTSRLYGYLPGFNREGTESVIFGTAEFWNTNIDSETFERQLVGVVQAEYQTLLSLHDTYRISTDSGVTTPEQMNEIIEKVGMKNKSETEGGRKYYMITTGRYVAPREKISKLIAKRKEKNPDYEPTGEIWGYMDEFETTVNENTTPKY